MTKKERRSRGTGRQGTTSSSRHARLCGRRGDAAICSGTCKPGTPEDAASSASETVEQTQHLNQPSPHLRWASSGSDLRQCRLQGHQVGARTCLVVHWPRPHPQKLMLSSSPACGLQVCQQLCPLRRSLSIVGGRASLVGAPEDSDNERWVVDKPFALSLRDELRFDMQ